MIHVDQINMEELYTVEFENMSEIENPEAELRKVIHLVCVKGFNLESEEIRSADDVFKILIDMREDNEIQTPPELYLASLLVINQIIPHHGSNGVVQTALKDNTAVQSLLANEEIVKLAQMMIDNHTGTAINSFLIFCSERLIGEFVYDENIFDEYNIDHRIKQNLSDSKDIHRLFARLNILLTKTFWHDVKLINFLENLR
jgi:hypothetical protein